MANRRTSSVSESRRVSSPAVLQPKGGSPPKPALLGARRSFVFASPVETSPGDVVVPLSHQLPRNRGSASFSLPPTSSSIVSPDKVKPLAKGGSKVSFDPKLAPMQEEIPSHVCEITSRHLLCSQCRSCEAERELQIAKIWFLQLSTSGQVSIFYDLITCVDQPTKDLLASLLRPFVKKDMLYGFALRKDYFAWVKQELVTIPLRAFPHSRLFVEWFASQATHSQQIKVLQGLFVEASALVLYRVYHEMFSLSHKAPKMSILEALPAPLAKHVLSFLTLKQLGRLARTSKYHYRLAKDVRDDRHLRQQARDFVLDLQAKGDPWLHTITSVPLPGPNGLIKTVDMVEENIFCGVYSVITFGNNSPAGTRVAHHDGGKSILTGSAGKSLELWDVKSGKCVREFLGHTGSVHTVCLASSANLALSGGFDTTIRVWDLKTGHCDVVLHGHRAGISCVVYDTKTLHVVSGSQDETLRVWTLKDAKCLHSIPHKSNVTCLFVCNGYVASGSQDGVVRYVNIETGIVLKEKLAHPGGTNAVCVDEFFFVSGGEDKTCQVRHLGSDLFEPAMVLPHPSAVKCLSFMSLRVVTGAQDGKIRIWNMLDGDCLRVLRGGADLAPLLSLHFKDASSLFVNSLSGMQLYVFEADKSGTPSRDRNASSVQMAIESSLTRKSSYTKPQKFSGQWRTKSLSSLPLK